MALARSRRERGAVAVEMAIILPLLLLVIGGIVDFGRAMFTQNVVTNAAREGARARALGYTTAQVDARVQAAMLSIDASTYSTAYSADCPSSPIVTDVATVTITVTGFDFIFPLPVSPPDLSAQSEMRCGG